MYIQQHGFLTRVDGFYAFTFDFDVNSLPQLTPPIHPIASIQKRMTKL
jgi:hypothetical protein